MASAPGWQYTFEARFSVHQDARRPLLRIHDSADGVGHLICAVSCAGRALALLVEADALDASCGGARAGSLLPRIVEGWSPVLAVVLGTDPRAIEWMYSDARESFSDVDCLPDGVITLQPVPGGRAELRRRSRWLATWLLLAVSDARAASRHAASPREFARLFGASTRAD